jgi:large subunit ribosomal protein L21
MKRAVIQIGGRQYIVREGDTIKTQLPRGTTGAIEIKDVLFLEDGNEVKIGRPHVAGASVRATIIEQKRGRKIRVLKYKSKTRYRKTIGFRPVVATLKIESIALQ